MGIPLSSRQDSTPYLALHQWLRSSVLVVCRDAVSNLGYADGLDLLHNIPPRFLVLMVLGGRSPTSKTGTVVPKCEDEVDAEAAASSERRCLKVQPKEQESQTHSMLS